MNQLDDRKLFVVSISQTSEVLRLYNLIEDLTISDNSGFFKSISWQDGSFLGVHIGVMEEGINSRSI
jgi:hypothetical protein